MLDLVFFSRQASTFCIAIIEKFHLFFPKKFQVELKMIVRLWPLFVNFWGFEDLAQVWPNWDN